MVNDKTKNVLNVDINKTKINKPVETRFIASSKKYQNMSPKYKSNNFPNQPETRLNCINNGNRNSKDATCLPVGKVNRVSTNDIKNIGGITGKHNPMLKNSLATIVRWYKGRCAYDINHKLDLDFKFYWQPSFHDSIIKSEKYLDTVRYYIHINPVKWKFDRNNPENIR